MLNLKINTETASRQWYPFRNGNYAIRGVRHQEYVSYVYLIPWPDCSAEDWRQKIADRSIDETLASNVFLMESFCSIEDKTYFFRKSYCDDVMDEYGLLLAHS